MEELELARNLQMFEMGRLTPAVKRCRIRNNSEESVYFIDFISVRGEIFEVKLQKSEVKSMDRETFNKRLEEELKRSMYEKYFQEG